MKKLLILLFMSLSLTVQSSSGPGWYDAPLEACFEAAEKGVYISKFNTQIKTKTQAGALNYCSASVRNFIYDGKEFSLLRISGKEFDICENFIDLSYAFCEYAEFNSPSKNLTLIYSP